MHGAGPTVGVDEVAELRALLRRRDTAARRIALALLRSWSVHDMDDTGARAVLEAAGGAYPSVDRAPEHPAELLAQLLWDAPGAVSVADVLRVYVLAGERARRALIHLLALRRDAGGLAGLEFVFGPDGAAKVLPVPTTPLLDPLENHPDRERVTELLIGVLRREGWSWHAADLLSRIEGLAPSSPEVRTRIVATLSEVAAPLVDTCNRAMIEPARSSDAARVERQSLAALMWLLDGFGEVDPPIVLSMMLGSSDPRVAAMAAARLHGRGVAVAPERIVLIARDPVARVDLHDAWPTAALPVLEAADLAADEMAEPDPFGPVPLAEGQLVRWLGDVTELGRAPDEIEHLVTAPCPDQPGEELFVFRFQMRSPHWSAARGWMVAISGAHTYTCYAAEDECSIDDHVTAMLNALAQWPDRRDDGAA